LDIFVEVANLLLGTDDTTKLLYFLKPHSFSNLNLPPEQCAVLLRSVYTSSAILTAYSNRPLRVAYVTERRVAVVVRTERLFRRITAVASRSL